MNNRCCGRHSVRYSRLPRPDNGSQGLGAVNASYFLLDATTGVPRAVLDGSELTLRRTACASAVASRYLSRRDAKCLLMIGTIDARLATGWKYGYQDRYRIP